MRSIVAALVYLFCDVCLRETAHTVTDVDLDEVYSCRICGATKTYRVR